MANFVSTSLHSSYEVGKFCVLKMVKVTTAASRQASRAPGSSSSESRGVTMDRDRRVSANRGCDSYVKAIDLCHE
jgi:hypothetical protein